MNGVVLTYPHQKAGHCGSGALRDLMDWADLGWGSAPSEGLVFALGGALDFAYLRDHTLRPPVYLVGRGADMELDLLRRLGAHAELRQTDDPALGWKWVTAELDEGRPVMVWADIAELPYLRVRLQMSRHDIVIIGYDDDTQLAHVVDNDRDNVQTVTYQALARARASTGFPVPTRHATYIVEWPHRLPPLAPVAADALSRSARTLRHGGGDAIATPAPGGVCGNGLHGVRTFTTDLGHWPDIFDTSGLNLALGALAAFIEKAGTGGGLFRQLLARGCAEIAHRTADPHAYAAAEAAQQAARAWTALAAAAASTDNPAQRATLAAQRAAVLPNLEETLAAALAAAHSLGTPNP